MSKRACLLLVWVLVVCLAPVCPAKFGWCQFWGFQQTSETTTTSIPMTWSVISSRRRCTNYHEWSITFDNDEKASSNNHATHATASGLSPETRYNAAFYVRDGYRWRWRSSKWFYTACNLGRHWTGSQCENCPRAEFRDNTDFRSDCEPCHATRDTTDTGATSLDACLCRPGYTGDLGNTACAICPENTFKATLGNDGCEPCPGGKVSPEGSTSSLACQCPPGRLWNAAESECQPCPVGSFKSETSNAIVCTACSSSGRATTLATGAVSISECVCSPGAYGPGAGNCTACDVHSFSNTTDLPECFACPTGYKAPDVGAASSAECSECTSGYFGNGGPTCTACDCGHSCADGTHGDGACSCDADTGFVEPECTECLITTFWGPSCNLSVVCAHGSPSFGVSGTGTCTECESAAWDFDLDPTCQTCDPLNSGPDCKQCDPGFSNQVSGPKCAACPSGHYKSGTQPDAACVQCPAGTHGPSTGLHTCEDCVQGTFQASPGQTECSPCPAGTTTPASGGAFASSQCTECPVGTYKGQGAGACLTCPGNQTTAAPATASAELCGCNAGYMSQQGYCVACANGTTSTEFSADPCHSCPEGTVWDTPSTPCMRCPFGGYCAGGATAPVAAPGFFPGADGVFESCSPPEVCLMGAQCLPGHTGPRCAFCETGWVRDPNSQLCTKCPRSIWVLFLVLFLLGGVLLVLLVRFARKNTSMLTPLAVAFNYANLLGVLASFRLKTPAFVRNFLDVLSATNLDLQVFKPECLAANDSKRAYTTVFALKLSSIWFLWVMLLAGFVVMVMVSRVRPAWVGSLRLMSFAFQNAAQLVALLLYLMVTATALEIYPCETAADGRLVMTREPSIECGSAKWRELLAPSILTLLLFSVALPLLLSLLLFRRRENLWKKKNLRKYGLLFLRYKPSFYLYEICGVLPRKLGVVIGKVLFSRWLTAQVLLALAVVVASLIAQLRWHPYAALRVNRLDSVMMSCAVIVLSIASIYAAAGGDMGDEAAITLGVVLVMVICLSLLILFVAIAIEMRKIWRLRNHGFVGAYALDSLDLGAIFTRSQLSLVSHHQPPSRFEFQFTTAHPARIEAQMSIQKRFVRKGDRARSWRSYCDWCFVDNGDRTIPVHRTAVTSPDGCTHYLHFDAPVAGYYDLMLVVVESAHAASFVPPPPPTSWERFLAWMAVVLDGRRQFVLTPEMVRAMMVDGGECALRLQLTSSPEWTVQDSMCWIEGDADNNAMLLAGHDPLAVPMQSHDPLAVPMQSLDTQDLQ